MRVLRVGKWRLKQVLMNIAKLSGCVFVIKLLFLTMIALEGIGSNEGRISHGYREADKQVDAQGGSEYMRNLKIRQNQLNSVNHSYDFSQSNVSLDPNDPCTHNIISHLESTLAAVYQNNIRINCVDVLFPQISPHRETLKNVLKSKRTVFSSIGSDTYVTHLARDCDILRSRGYVDGVSQEERHFPIAYSIVAHKDAAQVERLLLAIWRPQNVYCIHIDYKSSYSFKRAIRKLVDCFDNVFVPEKVETVLYAGITRLLADMHCMKELLESSTNWKYVLNIAGQAFPLRTNWELVHILKLYDGANDIEGGPPFVNRYIKKYVEKRKRLVVTEEDHEPPPHNLTIVKGSAYNVLSRAFVAHVFSSAVARDLLLWSRDTYSPDEHFWATLHHLYDNPQLHSPGGYRGPARSKPWLASYSAWPPADPCHGRRVRWLCIFSVLDLPDLINRHELFVNKFYADYESASLVCLGSWSHARSRCQPRFEDAVYRALPFVANRSLVNV